MTKGCVRAENKINFVVRSCTVESLFSPRVDVVVGSVNRRDFSLLSTPRRVFPARRENSGGFIFCGKSQRVRIIPVITWHTEYNASSTERKIGSYPASWLLCRERRINVHSLHMMASSRFGCIAPLAKRYIRKR